MKEKIKLIILCAIILLISAVLMLSARVDGPRWELRAASEAIP